MKRGPAPQHDIDDVNGLFGGPNGDDDLSSGLSGFEVTHRLGRLAEGICPVDDRGEITGFDYLGQAFQIGVVLFGDERGESLSDERRKRHGT